MPITIKS